MDHSKETFPAVLMHCTIDFSPFVRDLIFSLASFDQKIDVYLICFILPTGSVSAKASTGPVVHSSLY